MNLITALIFALCFALGLGFAFLIFKQGFKMELADIPNERSSHVIPVPKGGGVGIPIAMVFFLLIQSRSETLFILLALILSLVSLVNDRRELPAFLRMSLQFLMAFVLVFIYKSGLIFSTQPKEGIILPLMIFLFLVLYVVSTTNFFNFMDGIDGIAGVEGVISFVSLGVYGLLFSGNAFGVVLCFSVAFAVMGFLLLNFPKAKVFMGDVGSIFLGFLFASMVIILARDVKEFLLLALFQSLFYIDSISTIFLRLIKREKILSAHKSHLYQRMVHSLGFNHSRVVLWYAGIQSIGIMLGLLVFKQHTIFLLLIWIVLVLVYWVARIKLDLLNN
jgi:UDP-N-acetylmuramyl pentapeptide phosphotransferase/UDP-N-acetylglucosamine-1-phosphate transferase